MIHPITIDATGLVEFVHDDELHQPLSQIGAVTITRASHVEPDEKGKWWADLSPVNGPLLGPYRKRGSALRAERRWINKHKLGGRASGPA